MKFTVGSTEFDTEHLEPLGGGSYGEVYACSPQMAAKIIYDISEPLARKLLQICDIGIAMERDPEIANCVAFPSTIAKGATGDQRHEEIVGFAMRNLGKRPHLLELGFDLDDGKPRQVNGRQLSDEALVLLAFRAFQVLQSLERRHIVVGDVSYNNLLLTEANAPAFVDLDSAHIGDWESDSNGTESYTDPDLYESDRNSMGGLRFSSKSDVYALTVLIYEVVIGKHPHDFDSHPPISTVTAARSNVTTLRIVIDGESCLKPLGVSVAKPAAIAKVANRIAAIRRITGTSGRDGELLIEHFDLVLNRGDRTNLIDRLPDSDPRSPWFARLVRIGFPSVQKDWTEMHGPRRVRSRDVVERRMPSPFDFDPPALNDFLSTHGIDRKQLVAHHASA